MAAARLEMIGISKSFGPTRALDSVNLQVSPGEVHALVGENGAGKSTLMKVLSGAVAPDVGLMRIDGKLYAPRNPLDARRAGVAMIYQELSLAPHLTVQDNILLGMEPTTFGLVRRREVRSRARAALGQLDHAEISPDAKVASLSIAARQLVEIARAIAVGCRVLILDEPTSSLSQSDTQRLFDLIARLRSQGHAIVYISHFIEEVQRVADRLTILRDGKTVFTGVARDVTPTQIVTHMVGRQIEQLYPRSPRTRGPALLEVSNLSGSSKPRSATLTLHQGEVLGIAGLVGAGRTELLRCLFGLDPVRSGQIRIVHYSGAASPTQRWRQGVGMLSEDRKSEGLAVNLSIADNVALTRLPRMTLPHHLDRAASRWIDQLAIKCRSPRQRILDLSGGNQQKVAFARLLHHDAHILLLDEPTRGIDVASKAQIYQLIDRLARGDESHQPRSVLLVSSYLPELLGVCDRIAVMHRGVLSEARPAHQWTEESLLLHQATGAQAFARAEGGA